MNRVWFAGAVLAGSAALSIAAQQVFRIATDTVVLSVTAVDGGNHPIVGLDQNAFQVSEDGVVQDLSLFARDPQPIALSLLIDSSSSMEEKLSTAQAAASGFCRRLGPNDVAQIIDFNNQTNVRQTFTHDQAALERAIHQIHAGGSTSLYTAIYVAMKELADVSATAASPVVRRQAIIVLSDGEDTTSLLPYDDVIDQAKRSPVAIYTIGLREGGNIVHNAAGGFNEADFALRTLAQTTGGRAFFVDDLKMLPEIYQNVADELANQYVIGYVSKNVARDGAWRQVTVRVTRPESIVRTKAGYFGPKDSENKRETGR